MPDDVQQQEGTDQLGGLGGAGSDQSEKSPAHDPRSTRSDADETMLAGHDSASAQALSLASDP